MRLIISLEDLIETVTFLKGNYKAHDLYDVLSKRYPVFEGFEEKDVLNGKRINVASSENKILMAKDDRALAIYEKDGDAYKCVRGLW